MGNYVVRARGVEHMKGFTLLEVMIVTVLLLILITLMAGKPTIQKVDPAVVEKALRDCT